jgi:two-component system OmpR family response regulator
MNDDPVSILIVDDEPSVRDSLAEFLDDSGYRVRTAGNGESALEMLDASAFSIAIVDICLPGISGETFVLRAHAKYPRLKFMIHTGSAGYRLSEQLEDIGIRPHQVFLKPLMNLNVFLDTLKALLHGQEED